MKTPIPPHFGQPVASQGRPLDGARAAVIMLHGRGASPESILTLVSAISHPQVAYLAPAAQGGTWYPLGFMSPIEKNEPGITSGIGVVHALLERVVAAGVPEDRVILLGFSQGACLASTAMQRRPRRYGGLLAFSGGLIGPPGMMWSADGTFGGTPAFFGCSDIDAHIPEGRVRESAKQFERMGAAVTCRIYEGMGHLVNEDEVLFARELISAVAG